MIMDLFAGQTSAKYRVPWGELPYLGYCVEPLLRFSCLIVGLAHRGALRLPRALCGGCFFFDRCRLSRLRPPRIARWKERSL
jgi:hypothetical protein